MNRPAKYEELTRLLSGLVDGGLTDEDRAQLTQLLENDAHARLLYLQYIDLHVELARLVPGVESADQRSNRRHAPSRKETRALFRRSRPAMWILVSAAAVILVALTTWLASLRRPMAPTPVAARLTCVQGTVQVGKEETSAMRVAADRDLTAGERIQTLGETSLCAIEFADGTRLLLLGDTVTILQDAVPKRVAVLRGVVVAAVVRQATEAPMVVTTPRAEVQVLGTEFALAADRERTDLRVTAGRVKLTRRADGASVEVTPGKFVRATERSELSVHDVQDSLDRWEVDFEAGLPEGWQQGEWTAERLPPGSRGGVRTAALPQPGSDKPWHGIATAKSWVSGLFAVHEDSILNLTFKMDRPGWMQLFLVTRDTDLKAPRITVYSVSPRTLGAGPAWWNVPAGTWQTARIPLGEFKRLPEIGPHPSAASVPFQLVFSSQDRDRGFVIDRIWVSRASRPR